MADAPTVAIALQGGGSHAAFGAGVLRRLLGPELRERFRLVALSGTSGGAMCAVLAWAGLIGAGPEDAIDRLTRFWHDLEARSPVDAAGNALGLWFARLPVTVDISPYLYPPVAATDLLELLHKHLDLARLPADADRRGHPKLLIGATDIVERRAHDLRRRDTRPTTI